MTDSLRFDSDLDDLDMIQELQLRRWARENYVTPDQRDSSQHPVVENEMRIKDAELIIDSRSRESAVAFVPLAPTLIQALHSAHEMPAAPMGTRQPERETSNIDEPQWLC